jgi:hypothetical protein
MNEEDKKLLALLGILVMSVAIVNFVMNHLGHR